MTKGLKKRLIVLSVCLATFYLIPGNGYGQDAPVTDPTTEQDQPQPIGEPQKQTDDKPYKDEVLFGDSTNRFGGGYWDYVKFNDKNGGYSPYSSTGGGGDPNVPIDPDEQVPFDDGLLALLAFGLLYGFIHYQRRLKPLVAGVVTRG